jgi:hypothetical protein
MSEIALIGEQLDRLRRARNLSDYVLSQTVATKDATVRLVKTAELHSAIDSFGLPKIVAYVIQHIRELANTRTAG